MYESNPRTVKHQSYSNYIKAAYASAFTIGTFLIAKTTGFLPAWFSSEESSETSQLQPVIRNRENYQMEKRYVGGSEFVVDTGSSFGVGSQPVVATLNNGNFAVAWTAYSSATGNNIYAKTFDSLGNSLVNGFLVNRIVGQEKYPSITAGNGTFTVAWNHRSSSGNTVVMTYGQSFDLTGNFIGNTFQQNSHPFSSYSAIASLTNNKLAVFFNENYASARLFGNQYDILGNSIGNTFSVSALGGDLPDAIGLANGDYVVCWGGLDIFVKQYTNNNVALGNESQVNDYTYREQSSSKLASLGNQGYVVVWQSDGQDRNGYGIFGRLYSLSSIPRGLEFQVNTYTQGNQWHPDVTGLSDGSFIVVWEDDTQNNNLPGIYGQRFDANGQFLGTGFQVGGISASVAAPSIAPFLNGCIVVWKETDIINGKIKGKRILFSPPTLINNNFILTEGASTTVTNSMLSANDGDTPNTALIFTISQIQRGRFESMINPGQPINSFTQQEVIDGNIQFVHDGSQSSPSFSILMKDDLSNVGPYNANINFININDLPVLVANQLAIFEGQVVILTSGNLKATDVDSDNDSLFFIISNVLHGQFEKAINPGQPITQFTQLQIENGDIQFVHRGGKMAPGFSVSVSDGVSFTPPVPVVVNFLTINNKPQLLRAQITISKGQTVILNASHLNATDDETPHDQLEWTAVGIQQGQFAQVSIPHIAISNFTQLQLSQQAIQFTHDGSVQAPAFYVLISDGFNLAGPFPMSVSFNQGNSSNQVPVLINHKLIVNQGEVFNITSKEISATSTTSNPQQLKFLVEQVSNGRFQLITNPGVSIIEFLQSQITNSILQFAHLGGGIDKPAFKVSVTDGTLVTQFVDGEIDFDAAPQLINNKLAITNGRSIALTDNYLKAIDVDSDNTTLRFRISDIQHGQFKVGNILQDVNSTSFLQQQISDGSISFTHDGSGIEPSYLVSVTDGRATTAKQLTNILFTNAAIRQVPVLGSNKFMINQNDIITLTQKEINASSVSVDNTTLLFIVDKIGNGRFQLTTEPGIFITQFSQEKIINGRVQFVHLGGGRDKPLYQLSVSDGELASNFTSGIIDFDAAPQFISNTLSISNGETVVITSANLQASDVDNNNATLIFKLSNVMHGNFISSNNGTVTTFTQQDITDSTIRFVHDGLGNAPSYTVSVSDGRASSQNQTATVSFVKQNNGQFPTLNIRPLMINQGEVVTLTAKEISANSTVSDPQLLKFTASQVSNGRFQLTTNPGVSITEFLQSQITNSTVQFVHLGSGIDKPAFMISVADDLLASPIVDGEIDFDAAPQLIDNKLSIINGKTVTLTSTDLRAIDIDSDNATLKFQISDITHGQFKVADNLQPSNTASFSQQQIVDRVISFIHDGSGIEPSYFVTVSDGRASTAKQLASVFFSNAANRQKPVLGNHQFFINQNDIITLTHQEISASSASVDNSTLLFIVDKIGNGRFQLVTEPGIFITQFSQEKINNGNIQFAHTGSGSDKPSYTMSVSDGELSTDFSISIIDFNAAPQLINNTLNINNGQAITINSGNLQALDLDSNNATLLFKLSNVVHGKFISSRNGTNNLPVTNFIQQDISDGLIKFVHDGSNAAPAYTVSVSDGRAHSANQTATILFDSTNSVSNTPAIIGGIIAGVGGAGLLLAGLGLFAKKQIDQSTRNKHRLAAYIWQELKLQGVDNFGTDLGKKYVAMIEDALIPELKQHGYDLHTMEDKDLRELSKSIAAIAKNKITHSTTFFGLSLITVDDLSRNISSIVQGVLEESISDTTNDNYHLLEDDDENIQLKPYTPSFHLNSVKYDQV